VIIKDKFSTMEILWSNICKEPENYKSPLWHKELLDKREKQIVNGNDVFEDWDDVKKEIWNKVA